jgi:hypothetical protein
MDLTNPNWMNHYIPFFLFHVLPNCEFFKLIVRLIGGGLAPSRQNRRILLEIPWLAKSGEEMDLMLEKWI